MRYTKEELDFIRSTFKGNDFALKTLRKVFLPEYDFNAPIGQTVDMWVSLNLEQIPKEDREVVILSRNKLIVHLEKQIQELKILADIDSKTLDELEERAKKDSNK